MTRRLVEELEETLPLDDSMDRHGAIEGPILLASGKTLRDRKVMGIEAQAENTLRR